MDVKVFASRKVLVLVMDPTLIQMYSYDLSDLTAMEYLVGSNFNTLAPLHGFIFSETAGVFALISSDLKGVDMG